MDPPDVDEALDSAIELVGLLAAHISDPYKRGEFQQHVADLLGDYLPSGTSAPMAGSAA
ncbi:hypothetical protein [Cumulibacter soli]|uniref:hypothetical protein n=1 Tax=Cumulibacter soli TaxID=2546344 RepID=UPI0014197E1A|nr:hypothetical protein [Cumulibacter soli]